MKPINHLKIVISLLILFVFTSSCNTNRPNYIEQSSQTALHLIDRVLKTYDKIDSLTYQEKYQQDMIEVLSNPVPKDMELPDNKRTDYSVELTKRKQAFSKLRNIFLKLSVIRSNRPNFKKPDIKALYESYGVASRDNGLGFVVDTVNYNLQKAKKPYEHFAAIRDFTGKYIGQWNADFNNWDGLVDRICSNYVTYINEAPISIYDTEKIKSVITEPYKDNAALVQLYRLQLRKNAETNKNAMKQELANISKAIEKLDLLLNELSKKEPNESDLENYLEQMKRNLE